MYASTAMLHLLFVVIIREHTTRLLRTSIKIVFVVKIYLELNLIIEMLIHFFCNKTYANTFIYFILKHECIKFSMTLYENL